MSFLLCLLPALLDSPSSLTQGPYSTQWRSVWEPQRHHFTEWCLCVYWFSSCKAVLCSQLDKFLLIFVTLQCFGLGNLHHMHTHQVARDCVLHFADFIHSVVKYVWLFCSDIGHNSAHFCESSRMVESGPITRKQYKMCVAWERWEEKGMHFLLWESGDASKNDALLEIYEFRRIEPGKRGGGDFKEGAERIWSPLQWPLSPSRGPTMYV